MVDWRGLPPEIIVLILRCASFQDHQCALNISLVSSWANELAREALLEQVVLPDLRTFRQFIENTIHFSRSTFPTSSPLHALLCGPVTHIPELNPSQLSRERASSIRHLWLIFSSAIGFDFQDHVHIRILLQLCQNLESLAVTSVALSHFLRNKREHFALEPLDATLSRSTCIHSRLTHLTIHSPIPPPIMELEYANADPCVQIFSQVTHLTIIGMHTRTGLPVDIRHFPSLSHLAIPLIIPSFENIHHSSILNGSMLPYMIGWDLLSREQIKKIVFLFSNESEPCRCPDVTPEEYHVCPPFVLPIVNATLTDRKAYILPCDGQEALQKVWMESRDGGIDLWGIAEKIFELAYYIHHGEPLYTY